MKQNLHSTSSTFCLIAALSLSGGAWAQNTEAEASSTDDSETLAIRMSHSTFAAERPPNIVLIFIDDQGYADVGCFGAVGFETPNIDRLARQGMRFTSFYASQAVCSASRASLLTGSYANRVGVYGAYMPWSKDGLNPDEETIAELLQQRGYATGAFGKWHLGHQHAFLPLQQGFDEYLGLPYSNDMWPVHYDGEQLTEENAGNRKWKLKYPQLPLIDGNEKVAEIRSLADQDTLTTRYTERAVAFVEKHADEPFFLYLPHSMVHVPLGVSDRFRGKSEQGLFGDVMMEVDWSVGEVLRALDEQGVADNTLVIYTSDNGPWMNFGNHAGSAAPLREGKGTMWEGGCRVPTVMRWPGQIPVGTTCEKIGATIDVLPTICEITGAPLPAKTIDGVSILSLMMNQEDAAPREDYAYYYGRQLQAVRQGRWKLHLPHTYRLYTGFVPGADGFPGPTGTGRTGFELYDLEEDVREFRNVADQNPEIVERIKRLAAATREKLGDKGIAGSEQRPAGKVE